MSRTIEIVKGIGFVFEKKKLVVMCPVGSSLCSEDNFKIEDEINMLRVGVQIAFPCDALYPAYQNLEGLKSFLGKPSAEIPLVLDVCDYDTDKTIEEIYNKFEKKFNIKEKYINEGYDFRFIPYIYNNLEQYLISEEELESLNILKIDSRKFDLKGLIETARENMYGVINLDCIPTLLRNSRSMGNVFVPIELSYSDEMENSDFKMYIPFAYYEENEECEERAILLGNGEYLTSDSEDYDEIELNAYFDMGDLELGESYSIGYLVEQNNGELSVKIANYIPVTPSGQELVQVMLDNGEFTAVMSGILNGFIN